MNNGKRLDVESLMCTIIEARAYNYFTLATSWHVNVKWWMNLFSPFIITKVILNKRLLS